MAYLDDVTNILEIRPNGLPTVVRLSQNENGRKLYFRLTGNETAIPSGVTVTISGTKPDGVVYSATGSITNDVVLINENTQMTAVAGTWDAKIKIVSSGQTIATGRVRFEIDADTVAPGSVPSDSELEGLVAEAQAYAENARSAAYGSPLTASTVAGMTDQTRVYVYTGSETGYTAGNWYYWNGTAWTSGGVYNSTALQTDTTLAIPGMAADAKATGDAIDGLDARLDTAEDDITDVKSDLVDMQEEIDEFSGGLTPEIKEALLDCFAHVVWTDNQHDYYGTLEDVFRGDTDVLTATLDLGYRTVYNDDPVDSIKYFLDVQFNGETVPVSDYTLSGTLTSGNSILTVTYNEKSTQVIVPVETMKWRYSFEDGDLALFAGDSNKWSIDASPSYGGAVLKNGNKNRTFYAAKGRYPYYLDGAQATIQEDKFPIPVPSTATSVTITPTPSTYFTAINCKDYRPERFPSQPYVQLNDEVGFGSGARTLQLPSGTSGMRIILFNIRRNSSGTDYTSTTNPTGCVIQFS